MNRELEAQQGPPGSDGVSSVEALTLMTIQQLKYALQSESDRAAGLEAECALLHQHNAALTAELESREREVETESACLQLTLQSTTHHPTSPGFLPRALHSLLPPHFEAAVALTCLVRVGESWTALAPDARDGAAHRSLRSNALDEAARSLKPESPLPLLPLVPADTVSRLLEQGDRGGGGSGETKEGSGGGVEAEGWASEALEGSMVMCPLSRCLWLVTPRGGRCVGGGVCV